MESTTSTEVAPVTPVIMTPDAIRSLPAIAMPGAAGVTYRVVWEDGAAMGGIMSLEAGAHLGKHTHRTNEHHVWVIEGSARILGSLLGPGSYVHIPSGTAHDIDASSTSGCTLFYLYLRHAR